MLELIHGCARYEMSQLQLGPEDDDTVSQSRPRSISLEDIDAEFAAPEQVGNKPTQPRNWGPLTEAR